MRALSRATFIGFLYNFPLTIITILLVPLSTPGRRVPCAPPRPYDVSASIVISVTDTHPKKCPTHTEHHSNNSFTLPLNVRTTSLNTRTTLITRTVQRNPLSGPWFATTLQRANITRFLLRVGTGRRPTILSTTESRVRTARKSH